MTTMANTVEESEASGKSENFPTREIYVSANPPDTHPVGWWDDARRKAWETYQSLPFPTRKDEDWRFASVHSLKLDDYLLAPTPSPEIAQRLTEKSLPPAHALAKTVFVNDALQYREANPELAALENEGLIWKPLSEAVTDHQDLLERYFLKGPAPLGSRKFASLHEAHCRAGMLLYVPKNLIVEQPLATFHWISGSHTAVFPHTLVIAEAHAQVQLIDYYQSDGQEPGFACSMNQLFVGEGANVRYNGCQNWNDQTLSFQINSARCSKDSNAQTFYLNLGGNFARIENQSHLKGSGARSEMLSISLPHGTQEYDQRTLQHHAAPHTWSDLLYKNALAQRSRSIFSGLIKVDPGAKQTDAYQTNRNLLLNPEAEADSMPGLEILDDDVKCSHGATTGQLEEEELFYLLSRGINIETAKNLIAQGFLKETTSRITDSAIREEMERLIGEKFRRVKALDFKSGESKVDTSSEELDQEINIRKLQGLE